MSFTSFFFFFFLGVAAIIYYLLPIRIRWIGLLAASIVFYTAAGTEALPYLLGSAFLCFVAALILGGTDRKKKKTFSRLILFITLFLLVGFLAFTKFYRLFIPGGSIVVPLGLSYYTFSAVGYLLDIYWMRYEPEKNYFRFLLYISFFPHILQGPIPRYQKLAPQLARGHEFSYKRVTFGIQRILYGLFQKLVIADRLGLFVENVISDYTEQYGAVLFAAVFFYAIQVYTDFAGCVNIAAGAAQIFGIELEENFRQPYFSRSVDEFWRRWHMTLGHWFRDYVGMPVSASKPVKKLSRYFREKKGRDAGKNAVTLSALAVVWLCTGLWHGTGMNYMLWALWQGGIIAMGVLLRPYFRKWKEAARINDNSKCFRLFQMLRTFLLAGIIPRIITRAPSLDAAVVIFKNLFFHFGIGKVVNENGVILGWTVWDYAIISVALLIQFAVSILKERGVMIREGIAGFVLPLRWLIYIAALYAVVIFGKYGPGFDAVDFVYMDF
ncbi:MAG: hypothetical protein K5686_07445 [Lachnospiraceae bacterium]|nr:hypothetical protein [Lachnospiraceae bacterium]